MRIPKDSRDDQHDHDTVPLIDPHGDDLRALVQQQADLLDVVVRLATHQQALILRCFGVDDADANLPATPHAVITMTTNHSPAFLFYVEAWRASPRVQAMSWGERGMYHGMLIQQWDHGAVPATPAACAHLLGGKKIEWERAWPKLSACFSARARDGLLVNPKLEAVRRERQRFLKSQRKHGLRGAQQRWKQHGKPIGSLRGRYRLAIKKNGDPIAINRSKENRSKEKKRKQNRTDLNTHTARARVETGTNGDPLRASFDAFWTVYPKKVGKEAAWAAWRKRQPTADLVSKILTAIDWQRTQDTWLRERGRFVPNPATWINQGRWDDEPVTTPHVSDKTLNLARATQEFLHEDKS